MHAPSMVAESVDAPNVYGISLSLVILHEILLGDLASVSGTRVAETLLNYKVA